MNSLLAIANVRLGQYLNEIVEKLLLNRLTAEFTRTEWEMDVYARRPRLTG